MQSIKIGGMSCMHCVQAVTKALNQVPGVNNPEVSLEKGEAVFEAGPELDMQKVKQAVQEAGYQVLDDV
ncbi:MAG: heavy-metal-associated domain-containing protein [Desulfohalobiaceae bacterium]